MNRRVHCASCSCPCLVWIPTARMPLVQQSGDDAHLDEKAATVPDCILVRCRCFILRSSHQGRHSKEITRDQYSQDRSEYRQLGPVTRREQIGGNEALGDTARAGVAAGQ